VAEAGEIHLNNAETAQFDVFFYCEPGINPAACYVVINVPDTVD
jgi:hypothetical protein